ncbi:hypothetical protein [Paracoccus homiensis]|uniref:Uncharacterized protein n=1 Tax=Paracoccus homiensis TaxID=364199 RepID=A0A1I0IZF6_9RHOB|nr:hypothetical protein [Paracoccus homiensis]SEU02775.1 hypothetical protein SAMN04489858_12035 [Paracoccus homiensis]
MILPTVIIDWPAQPAWPNRQKHWRPTANARDLQKNAAFYLAKEARWIAPAVVHRVHLTLTFCVTDCAAVRSG